MSQTCPHYMLSRADQLYTILTLTTTGRDRGRGEKNRDIPVNIYQLLAVSWVETVLVVTTTEHHRVAQSSKQDPVLL